MKGSLGERIVKRLSEFANALKNKEVISKRFTCRRIALDLRPSPYDPELVKKTRKLLNVSQILFAQFLGVSVKTVRAWEQGINTPNDMACRFMDEIQRNPAYWLGRLEASAKIKVRK